MRIRVKTRAGWAYGMIAGLAWAMGACGVPRASTDPALARVELGGVRAAVETTPVAKPDDAADDPAIWIDPVDPSRSLILGTDKESGLAVYGMDGVLRQFLPVGRVNNVDVRQDVALPWGGRADLVAASHRTARGVSVFEVVRGPEGATLRELPGSPMATTVEEPYGLCLARPMGSAKGPGLDVYVNDKSGLVEHWSMDLRPGSEGASDGTSVVLGSGSTKVRSFKLESQVEGMVADEALGRVYVGEERAGVWVIDGDARAEATPTLIVGSGRGGPLVADVEGITIVSEGTGDGGWLIVSSQGDHSYAVFDRRPPHRYVGNFRIEGPRGGWSGGPGGAAGAMDGAEETDGIDATSVSLGGVFSSGVFVAQDGMNGSENQNFKLVPWDAVRALIDRQERVAEPKGAK